MMISGTRTMGENPVFFRPQLVRSSDGLTILELLIAFVVLQIALVVFAQFMTKALDFSREVRRIEMAQILAQNKMEELIRTLPFDPKVTPLLEGGGSSKILNEGPASFQEYAFMQAEDVTPFRWIAEIQPLADNPSVIHVTLYVYVTQTRTKSEKASTPVDDFYVSEDRNLFSFARSLSDGTVEVINGKAKLRVSSAIALR